MKRRRSAEDHRAVLPAPAAVTAIKPLRIAEMIPDGCRFNNTLYCLGLRCVMFRARGHDSEQCITEVNQCS